MKSLKQHLLDHLTKSAEHHVAMASHHADLVEHHRALSEELDPRSEASELNKKIADCHKACADAHADRAQHFASLHEAVESGEDLFPVPAHEGYRGHGGDLDGPEKTRKAVPDQVRGALPDNKNVTPVPRFGGPTKDDIDMSKVPAEHVHLIRTN